MISTTVKKKQEKKKLGFGIHFYRPEASLQLKCKSKAEKGY